MSVCSSVKIIYLCGAECILHEANILKVFSHILLRKCGSFQKRKDKRTALISCLDYGRDVFCVPIPHIYSSVGYCVVYFRLGFTTTFLEINEISSTLSFCGYSKHHLGVEW